MNKWWIPLLAAALVSCSVDRTLDTLMPRNSLAVVLVEHPSFVESLGPAGTVPWKALDADKPWGAAVVPANPPGFVLAVALADRPTAWSELEQWARAQGGLTAQRVGTYALLSSPGLAGVGVLDPDRRFDLARVREGSDPVAVYIDVKNVATEAALPEALRPALAALPWAEKNLAGIRVGFAAKDGGLEMRVATDWSPGAEAAAPFRGWVVPSDPSSWTGSFPVNGVGVAASLPPVAWTKGANLAGDSELGSWWSALAPLLGPRFAADVAFGDKAGWSVSVETSDAQGVRQALRSLVAGGQIQRHFAGWALDADTPLIYQDHKEASGIRASVTWGPSQFQIGYGSDRVIFAGGAGSSDVLARLKVPDSPAPWVGQAPSGATALAGGTFDGMSAKAAFKVLADANLELRFWIDSTAVKTWEERLPRALLGWLSGATGSLGQP